MGSKALALLIRALVMSGEGILPCRTSSSTRRRSTTKPPAILADSIPLSSQQDEQFDRSIMS